MIGQTLAHYQIEEKLGEGGMGVVYRALDTHLDRPVAIKVLRAGAAADPERKKRFVQEAKTASALNHPNIVHIYDIDNAAGVDFIAMEFVDGKTLDHWIGRKGLDTASALKYAVQIADALAAAHAVPLIHRDIKPGNIMVTEAGHVKVLDFGLAKLVEPATDQDRTATLGQTPRTQEGIILGTVAYMSPEQASGRKLDPRSDIFSFGSVLYEMLTGQRAFQGENQISTLAAILNKEPKPVSEQLATVPRDLERVISRCLRKDPARRIQTMIDLKVALEELKEESDSDRLSAAFPAPPPARRFWPAIAVAAVILAAAVAVVVWLRSRAPAPTESLVLTRLTSDSGLTSDPAISADGKLVAYASDRGGDGNLDIWVQQVAGGKSVRLTNHLADDSDAAFSPDSSSIAFRSEREGGGIYVVSTLGGGDERLIAAQGRRPWFSPDGKLIAYTVGHRGGSLMAPGTGKIYVTPAAGGAPRQLFAEMASAGYPVWSPDGKRLLFRATARGVPLAERSDWWVAPLDGGPAVKTGAFPILSRLGLTEFITVGDWLAGDRILFSASQGDSTNLWQVTLDPATSQIIGEPQRLTSGTGREAQPSAAASSGRLVFASLAENLDLWSLPVDAALGKVTGEMARLTQDAADDLFPGLSADGSKLVFVSGRRGNLGLRLKNLADGRETVLAATSGRAAGAEITADGTKVAYAVLEDRRLVSYLVTLGPNGPTGLPQKLCDDCGWPAAWSSDGTILLFQFPFGASRDVSLLKIPSGERVKLAGPVGVDLALSPDNRWVAFGRNPDPGRGQIFVAALAGDKIGAPIPVTGGQERDSHARWSPDGRLLYFFSDRDGFRCLWAQRLDPAGRPLPHGLLEVQHLHRAQLSASDLPAAQMGLAVSRNRIVFTLNQRSGNVWMGERKDGGQ